MNVSPLIQKTIVSILIISAVGFVVFDTLFGEVELPQNTEGVVATEVVGQDILDLANKLESIRIDKTIFSGALFQSLVDISTPLSPEAQGRVNPFSQIGSDGGSSAPVSVRRP